MTLAEIRQSDAALLTASDVAEVLESDPQDIRQQAKEDPSKLGFPVCVIGSRVKIPRRAFLAFLGE